MLLHVDLILKEFHAGVVEVLLLFRECGDLGLLDQAEKSFVSSIIYRFVYSFHITLILKQYKFHINGVR